MNRRYFRHLVGFALSAAFHQSGFHPKYIRVSNRIRSALSVDAEHDPVSNITRSRETISTARFKHLPKPAKELTVRELKLELQRRGVDHRDIVDAATLERRVEETRKEILKRSAAHEESNESESNVSAAFVTSRPWLGNEPLSFDEPHVVPPSHVWWSSIWGAASASASAPMRSDKVKAASFAAIVVQGHGASTTATDAASAATELDIEVDVTPVASLPTSAKWSTRPRRPPGRSPTLAFQEHMSGALSSWAITRREAARQVNKLLAGFIFRLFHQPYQTVQRSHHPP